eukprot:2793847-Prymnesium_polylepis.1
MPTLYIVRVQLCASYCTTCEISRLSASPQPLPASYLAFALALPQKYVNLNYSATANTGHALMVTSYACRGRFSVAP